MGARAPKSDETIDFDATQVLDWNRCETSKLLQPVGRELLQQWPQHSPAGGDLAAQRTA
jgi:hypothetical protein